MLSAACLFLALLLRTFCRAVLAFSAGVLCSLARLSPIIAEANFANSLVGQELQLSGIIATDPKELEKETSLTLEQVSLRGKTLGGQLYVKISGRGHHLQRSDQITLRGKALSGFGNYYLYLWHPTVVSVSKPDPPDLALQFRQFLSCKLSAAITSEDAASLAMGFLLGEKVTMSDELTANLRQAGLAHVVVASGFALSVLVNFAKKYGLRISRGVAFFASIWLIAAFVSLTGFSASLLRAGIAALVALLAWFVGRRFHPVRLLIYVAALSVCISPHKFFSLAWQLSFASYAGILLLEPLLAKYLYGDAAPSNLSAIVLVSISAQLACLPLSLYYFGSFAVLGLVANLLVTPVIPLVMLLAFLVGLGLKIPFAVFVLQKILTAQLWVIREIGELPWATYQIAPGQAVCLWLYVPILILLVALKVRTKHTFRPSYSLDKSPDYGKIFSC